MRPTTLDEFVGQSILTEKGKAALSSLIEADKLSSVVFMVLREPADHIGQDALPDTGCFLRADAVTSGKKKLQKF